MALDEALLDAAGTGQPKILLRTYGWSVPTLSLGYFQSLALVRADPRWSSVAVLRRLTGGGAIWHHHELTYALAVPREHPLARPGALLYRAVHESIVRGFVDFGIRASCRGEVFPPAGCERSRPLLCFTDRSAEDILLDGTKIVGSAQRLRGGAVLQHGSVLLKRSCQTPELSGLCDVADVSADPRQWSGRLVEWIGKAVAEDAQADSLPDAIRLHASEREFSRYLNPAWTEIR